MHTVLSNVDAAIEFIISAEKEHPNRIDICLASTSGPASTSNSFNQGSRTTPFPASQSQTNPFGASTQPTTSLTFGTPSTAAPTGAFGQPSALGQKPNPFGGTAPALGAPTQPGITGSFGRPSVLGQKPNPFGAPTGGSAVGTSNSATAPFSSFAGTASAFSQPQPQQQQAANPFGAPSNPPIPSSFPTSSQPAQQNPFAQKSTQNSNPFSSQNPPSQQNPFGTTPTQLGATSPISVNPFAQTTASQATAPNQFSPTQLPATGSPLDVRQSSSVPQPLINGSTSVGPNVSLQHPSLESYSNKAIGGKLNMFKGMRVVYKGDEAGYNARDGTWQKIWFPQGAPAPCKDTEMDDSKYDESIKTAYMHLHQSRSFQGGAMPMIPPRREWCMFDF
jgi:nucleoporin NUP42